VLDSVRPLLCGWQLTTPCLYVACTCEGFVSRASWAASKRNTCGHRERSSITSSIPYYLSAEAGTRYVQWVLKVKTINIHHPFFMEILVRMQPTASSDRQKITNQSKDSRILLVYMKIPPPATPLRVPMGSLHRPSSLNPHPTRVEDPPNNGVTLSLVVLSPTVSAATNKSIPSL
jgi:hypothetical protein